MAFTIEKILGDARLLCTRLKDHDNAADTLIEQAQSLNTKVEAMQTVRMIAMVKSCKSVQSWPRNR